MAGGVYDFKTVREGAPSILVWIFRRMAWISLARGKVIPCFRMLGSRLGVCKTQRRNRKDAHDGGKTDTCVRFESTPSEPRKSPNSRTSRIASGAFKSCTCAPICQKRLACDAFVDPCYVARDGGKAIAARMFSSTPNSRRP